MKMNAKISSFELSMLATLLADNVEDTGPNAWDSPAQAVHMHEDDMSEVAVDRYGRRLTKKEWLAVSRKATPMVEDQFDEWRRAGKLPEKVRLVVYRYRPMGAIKQDRFALATGDRPEDIVSTHGTKETAVRAGEKLAEKTGASLEIEA